MKTQNIIQANVNVIRLVNLKKGDIFKIVEKDSYGDGITYNVVLEMYNTGENTFLEVLQYTKSYREVEAKHKIFTGDEDIAIFPASIDEVKEYFNSAILQLEEKIKKDKEELQNEVAGLEKAKLFMNGELSKQIQEAEFKEQTQDEYNSAKALKESKLKELE